MHHGSFALTDNDRLLRICSFPGFPLPDVVLFGLLLGLHQNFCGGPVIVLSHRSQRICGGIKHQGIQFPVVWHGLTPFAHNISENKIKCNILFCRILCSRRVRNVRYEVLKFEAIRNLRLDRGYTQQQIAEYLNIKQNTYSQYEIGVLNYPVDVLIKLADFYDVSVDYLLGRTKVKTPYPKA